MSAARVIKEKSNWELNWPTLLGIVGLLIGLGTTAVRITERFTVVEQGVTVNRTQNAATLNAVSELETSVLRVTSGNGRRIRALEIESSRSAEAEAGLREDIHELRRGQERIIELLERRAQR